MRTFQQDVKTAVYDMASRYKTLLTANIDDTVLCKLFEVEVDRSAQDILSRQGYCTDDFYSDGYWNGHENAVLDLTAVLGKQAEIIKDFESLGVKPSHALPQLELSNNFYRYGLVLDNIVNSMIISYCSFLHSELKIALRFLVQKSCPEIADKLSTVEGQA